MKIRAKLVSKSLPSTHGYNITVECARTGILGAGGAGE